MDRPGSSQAVVGSFIGSSQKITAGIKRRERQRFRIFECESHADCYRIQSEPVCCASKGRRWRIFISYATEDRPKAQTLADALMARGWSVWWDERYL
jgi:hypothetical protein